MASQLLDYFVLLRLLWCGICRRMGWRPGRRLGWRLGWRPGRRIGCVLIRVFGGRCFVVSSFAAISFIGGCSSVLPTVLFEQTPSKPFDKKAAAQARVNLGMRYLAGGNLPMARQNIEQALHHQPASYRAQLAMALYQQQTGEHSTAQRYYQRALQLAPQAGELLNNYGAFLCMQQHYIEAQHYFNAAIRAPGYAHLADSLQNSGLCYLQAGQPSSAQRLLQRVLKHQPGKGAHWLVLATEAFKQGQQQRAAWLVAIYEQLLPVSADSLWLHLQFSAQAGALAAVKQYGAQLARDFPHSPRYQQYLDHDY